MDIDLDKDVVFGSNRINFKSWDCYNKKGEKIKLSKKEILLLKLLIQNKNTVVSRAKIFQMVWGHVSPPDSRSIDNYIWRFRKYFEEDQKYPVFFQSIRFEGYMFKLSAKKLKG